MLVLTLLYYFKSKSWRNLVTKVATKPEFLVLKEKMLVALMTISAAILSPVNGMFTTILQKLVKLAESHLIGHPRRVSFLNRGQGLRASAAVPYPYLPYPPPPCPPQQPQSWPLERLKRIIFLEASC